MTLTNAMLPLEIDKPAKGRPECRVVYPLYRAGRRYFERLSTARCYARHAEGQVEQWVPPAARINGSAWEVVR